MTVKTILSNKGSNVTTTEPAATPEFGMRILAEHGIGALVVVGADQRVIGVLSERDIVRALAERGASGLTEPLARVMTRNESTCSPSDTVKSIMKQMTACKFRHLPVVEAARRHRIHRRRGQAHAHGNAGRIRGVARLHSDGLTIVSESLQVLSGDTDVFATAERCFVEAAMWRLTKAIIISWLVGVVCGVGIVIVSQRADRTPRALSAGNQIAPQTIGTAPASPDGIAR
jgi:CBS domain-containing protein